MATAVIMPRQGQSVESCILVEWLVKVGDSVETGTPVASIETDKAVFEVESPASGTLLETFFEAGDDVPVLTHIAAVGEPGEDVSSLKPTSSQDQSVASEDEAVATSSPQPAVEPSGTAELAKPEATAGKAAGISPRARQAAQTSGVDATTLEGSGPQGRVIERDVLGAAQQQPRLSAVAKAAQQDGTKIVPAQGRGPGGMVLAADLQASGAATRAPAMEPVTVPLKGIRKLIAKRMHESLASTAQITLNMSFDATALLAYRASIKAQGETLGLPNITLNDLIAFTVVRSLGRHPELNAHFLGDRTVQFPNVNLGIATDTDRGLMVPVVHGAERYSLSALSAAIKPLIKDCQTGSINPDLLTGGTFTITNMGMLGIETFTPVLNVPEVAILGVGALFLKPVAADDGSVRHVQAMHLSLTVDHQVVDGAPAARFLKDLCNGLEQVSLMLAV